MNPDDLEQRLKRYGETLEAGLGAGRSNPSDTANTRRRKPLLLAAVAAVAVILGVVGVVVSDRGPDDSAVVASSPEQSPDLADSLATQSCRDGYEAIVQDLESRVDEFGPVETDPTAGDAPAVVMRSSTEPEVAVVILRGDALVVQCRIPDGGFEGPWPDLEFGDVRDDPAPTAAEAWNHQGVSATNGPVTLRYYGRVGTEVQEVALVAGAGRSAGVIKDGWFLVDIVLQGRLTDLGEVALEWVTTTGVVERKVLLAYDEALDELGPVLDHLEPRAIPTLQPASPGVEFAACPASTDPYAPITGSEVADMLNDVSGTYRSSEEVLAISCVWAPEAVLHRGDESGSVAQAWSSAAVGGGFFELEPLFAVGLGRVSERSANGVVVHSLNPLQATGLRLEWADGRWLITDWIFQPGCEALLSAGADPRLPDSAALAIAVECS